MASDRQSLVTCQRRRSEQGRHTIVRWRSGRHIGSGLGVVISGARWRDGRTVEEIAFRKRILCLGRSDGSGRWVTGECVSPKGSLQFSDVIPQRTLWLWIT